MRGEMTLTRMCPLPATEPPGRAAALPHSDEDRELLQIEEGKEKIYFPAEEPPHAAFHHEDRLLEEDQDRLAPDHAVRKTRKDFEILALKAGGHLRENEGCPPIGIGLIVHDHPPEDP